MVRTVPSKHGGCARLGEPNGCGGEREGRRGCTPNEGPDEDDTASSDVREVHGRQKGREGNEDVAGERQRGGRAARGPRACGAPPILNAS